MTGPDLETTGTGSAPGLATRATVPDMTEFTRTRVWIERTPLARRLRREGALLALASLVLVVSLASPWLKSRGLWVGIPCVFNRITHLPCLTCGLTRSFGHMARGELAGALEYHLLGPALFLLVAVFSMYALVAVCTGRCVRFRLAPPARKAAFWSILAVFIAAWVLKISFMKVTW